MRDLRRTLVDADLPALRAGRLRLNGLTPIACSALTLARSWKKDDLSEAARYRSNLGRNHRRPSPFLRPFASCGHLIEAVLQIRGTAQRIDLPDTTSPGDDGREPALSSPKARETKGRQPRRCAAKKFPAPLPLFKLSRARRCNSYNSTREDSVRPPSHT
jgi:hypothetical protein